MAVISDRRPTINRRHWLYPEIVGLWIPVAGGRILANLAKPGHAESKLQSKGNAGLHGKDSLLAGDTVSSSDYTYKGGFLTPALYNVRDPMTIMWFGDVYGARSGNYNRIFGFEDTVGLNSSIEFQRNADDTSVNFHYEDNAFNGPEATVTSSFAVGKRQTLAGVLRVGGVSPFCFTYYNGIAGGTNNTFPTSGLNVNSQVAIGALTSNTTGYTNCGMHLGLWVNRDLYQHEVQKLHADPAQLYLQPWRSPRYFVIGSVATNATATPTEAVLVLAVPAPTITATGVVTPTEAVLVLAVPAPTITGTGTITPTEAVLTLAVPAPTITATGTVTPTEAVLVLAVDAPTITATGTATPTEAVLVLDVPAPTITIGTIVQPTEAVLVLAVDAPAILFDTTVTPTEAVLVLAVPAPTVTIGTVAQPTEAVLVLDVPAPTVALGATPTPTEAVLVLDVPAPTITTGTTPTPTEAVLVLDVSAPTIIATATVTPTEAVLVLDVPAPTITGSGTAAPTEAVLALAVPAPTITATLVLTPTEAVLVLQVPAPTVVGQQNALATPTEVVLILAVPAPTITALFLAGIIFQFPWLGPRWAFTLSRVRWETGRGPLTQRWWFDLELARWQIRPPRKASF